MSIRPTERCKHGEWTFGEICVRCNECGRFNPSREGPKRVRVNLRHLKEKVSDVGMAK